MSAYVLSFLDSMRQRTCFLGHLVLQGNPSEKIDLPTQEAF